MISKIDAPALATGASVANIGSGGVSSSLLAPGAARANFGAGAVLQVAYAVKTDVFATSGFFFVDIPGLSVTLNPQSSSSRFVIISDIYTSSDYYKSYINVVRNGTTLRIGDGVGDGRYRGTSTSSNDQSIVNAHGLTLPVHAILLDSPNTSSPVTYKLQASGRTASGYGITYINRTAPDRVAGEYDDRMGSSLIVMEIAG